MTDINIDSLEPNSHKYKTEKETKKERKKVSPVIERDHIVSTKKPLSKKIKEAFVPEDISDVKTWVIKDLIIPTMKDAFFDFVSMLFYGEFSSKKERGYMTDYRNYYNSRSGRNGSSRKPSYSPSRTNSLDDKMDFRNIIVRNRADAEIIVNSMIERIQNFGSVSVAELFDLIDAPSNYTDNNYGWDNERDIGLRRVSSGFLIVVSEPKYLG